MTERIEIYYDLRIRSRNQKLSTPANNQHVVPRGDEWAVRGEGDERTTPIHPTLGDAERAAREIAVNQQSEVVFHLPDGRIRDKNSYGHEPYPPKG
jgi:hypothetical protein